MRIAKVKLKNFKVYKGKHNIAFGEDQTTDANISVIAGQNGYGKTSFLTALTWAMYGRMIAEVEETYKKQIYEQGGYKEFAKGLINRAELIQNSGDSFYVQLELADIYIPSVPCSRVSIRREYFIDSEEEETTVLIDGFRNELANQVGADIFINDFILPREIAKFFFFDAEKIVSLAEIKSTEEKRQLSMAFSDILGIRKYETLRYNLENVKTRLKKKSAGYAEKNKLKKLQDDIAGLLKLIEYNQDEIKRLQTETSGKKTLRDQIQEKLIREGSPITVEELKQLKKEREQLSEESTHIKGRLKDLLELAPFAIAGQKLKETIKQLEMEAVDIGADINFVNKKLSLIEKGLLTQLSQLLVDDNLKEKVNSVLKEEFDKNRLDLNIQKQGTLLGFKPDEYNAFNAIYKNLGSTYKSQFESIVQEEKNNRNAFTRIQRKIQQSESKDSDLITQKYKKERDIIVDAINELENRGLQLSEEIGRYKNELANKQKVVSELLKKVRLNDIDDKKDETTNRLIKELDEFIFRFKKEKVGLFEMRIRNALYKLMHKDNFVKDCQVVIDNEIIDIHLLNSEGKVINKESLSKGEQQLYATAVLKALVEESGIEFPVFIDSPLQKFDKKHSNNIITYFYPTVSKQVILFPLLEKELTESEYNLLRTRIDRVFMIKNSDNNSQIERVEPDELFNQLKVEVSNV